MYEKGEITHFSIVFGFRVSFLLPCHCMSSFTHLFSTDYNGRLNQPSAVHNFLGFCPNGMKFTGDDLDIMMFEEAFTLLLAWRRNFLPWPKEFKYLKLITLKYQIDGGEGCQWLLVIMVMLCLRSWRQKGLWIAVAWNCRRGECFSAWNLLAGFSEASVWSLCGRDGLLAWASSFSDAVFTPPNSEVIGRVPKEMSQTGPKQRQEEAFSILREPQRLQKYKKYIFKTKIKMCGLIFKNQPLRSQHSQ